MNEPIGRFGSLSPTLPRLIAFATAVTAGFLQALTFTKLSDTTPEEQKRNVKELVVFFFGGLENRFENYK